MLYGMKILLIRIQLHFFFCYQYGGDILIHLPVVHAEELYEEMAQYINQRENSIMESLSDPDSLWNIVNGLLPPAQFC